jgi:hypothetical protein
MCDITKPLPPLPREADLYTEEIKSDWHAVVRYSVCRTQWNHTKGRSRIVLHTGLPYDAAKRMELKEDAALRREPSYRGGFCAPHIGIELEKKEETYAAYKDLRAERGG